MMRQNDGALLNQTGIFIWAWPDGPKDMESMLSALSERVFLTAPIPARRTVDEVEKQRGWHTALPFATDGIVVRSAERLQGALAAGKATGSWRGNIRQLRRLLR
jgi:DNA ligase (NAD+)